MSDTIKGENIFQTKQYKFHNMFEDKVYAEKKGPHSSFIHPPKRALLYGAQQSSFSKRSGRYEEAADKARLTKRKHVADQAHKEIERVGLSMNKIIQGRKKAFIPKFSQVLPNHQPIEAQQEIILRRKLKDIVTYTKMDVANNNVDIKTWKTIDDIRERTTRTSGDSLPPKVSGKEESQSICKHYSLHLPEVTISCKLSPSLPPNTGAPLNLSEIPQKTADQPKDDKDLSPNRSLPVSLVLQPEDYKQLTPENHLYSTYIFLPSLGVFVHPLAIPSELVSPPLIPLSLSSASASSLVNSHLQHLSHPTKSKHPLTHSPESLSICKYKFTPGNNPSLEEEKMIPVTFSSKCERLKNIQSHTMERSNNNLTSKHNFVDTTLVAINETQTGNGATFCTFKTGKRVKP